MYGIPCESARRVGGESGESTKKALMNSWIGVGRGDWCCSLGVVPNVKNEG